MSEPTVQSGVRGEQKLLLGCALQERARHLYLPIRHLCLSCI